MFKHVKNEKGLIFAVVIGFLVGMIIADLVYTVLQ